MLVEIMNVEILKSSDEELEFAVSGINASFANALRRVGMMQIPTFAIETALFYENSSAFFDEYIANRLALIPLKTEEDYKQGEIITLTLDAVGPCTVYSKDLHSTDAKIVPANDSIPILKLAQGQSLRVEARARLGVGREHAKFQSSLIAYKQNEKKPEEFTFMIDSFGQMTALEILKQATKILNSKCEELSSQL